MLFFALHFIQPFNLEGVELLSPRLFRIIFFHLVDFDFEIETIFCCVCVCVSVIRLHFGEDLLQKQSKHAHGNH